MGGMEGGRDAGLWGETRDFHEKSPYGAAKSLSPFPPLFAFFSPFSSLYVCLFRVSQVVAHVILIRLFFTFNRLGSPFWPFGHTYTYLFAFWCRRCLMVC